MQYSTNEKDFSLAKLICAPDTALKKLNRPKEENFSNAQYIWPFGCTRFHAYRLFTPIGSVKKAELAFLCDNVFDIWLNGKQIACETKHLTITDVTNLLRDGENNLHIRGYQSAVYDTFSSAMTGGIRIYYEDGRTEEIVTDKDFKLVQLTTFWDTQEPLGFEYATESRFAGTTLNVMDMHPIALRRSFLFVRDFTLNDIPKKATLYACALGCYEPYLNGNRITDSFFMPFCENYRKEYQAFDILPFIKEGTNTVGMISGNGWYNCRSWGTLRANIPEITAIIELEYENGNNEYIYSDEKWMCAPSPLVENDLQYGERYDARLEIKDWCSPQGDRADFTAVSCRDNTQLNILIEQNYPPIKKVREHTPLLIRTLPDGSPLFDIGVCIAGRAKAIFKGLPRGKSIRIRYCERLTKDGLPENGAYVTVYFPNDCAPDGKSPAFLRNVDVYTAKGEPTESYECRFSYTGFRYIWVEGLESPEQLCELVAFELHNDVAEAGEIITDNIPLRKIFDATKRAWLNNIFNGPTDCPTREKNFWNGDTQLFSHTACWLTDNSQLLSRWTDNGHKMHDGPYGWEDETYELPMTLYRFYGDKEILRRRFPKMLDLIEKRVEFEGMILPENPCSPYCDWLSPTGISPDKQFFSGCWHYHSLVTVAQIAEILGEQTTADDLRMKAEISRNEFNKRHLVDNGSDYDARNQCGIVLPLAFGIAPEESRQALADTLAEYIRKEDYHLTTGFIGTRFLPEILADYGYIDIVYKLIAQDSFPSWMNMLNTGATAITESWRGTEEPDKSISMAHFSLGTITGFFFEYLGGIRIKDCAPGLSHLVLRPHPVKEIGALRVNYKSAHGTISTEWHYEGNTPVFSYTLPEGVTAEVQFE